MRAVSRNINISSIMLVRVARRGLTVIISTAHGLQDVIVEDIREHVHRVTYKYIHT